MPLSEQNVNNSETYYQFNMHGDVIGLTGANGELTEKFSYDAFGNQLNDNASSSSPFRYNGQYTDAESGLIYLRNRYYDPAAGRFTQEDPAKDGLNWYVYCKNSPLILSDPNGLAVGFNTLEDVEKFMITVQVAFDNDNIHLNAVKNEKGYIIDKSSWKDDFTRGEHSSDVGIALLKVLIFDSTTFRGNFTNDKTWTESSSGNLSFTMNGWDQMVDSSGNLDKKWIASVMMHEMTHTYTLFYGHVAHLERSLTNPSQSGVGDLSRKYMEATAITVEEQFRKDIGYVARSEQIDAGIGKSASSYGCWPLDYVKDPNGKMYGATFNYEHENRAYNALSMMETYLIHLDIIRRSLFL